MDVPSLVHPSDDILAAFGLGKLEGDSAESVHAHLEACDTCRKRVAEIAPDSFLGRVRQAQGGSGSGATQPSRSQPAATSALDDLPPGLANHPDYEIKRELGRGGMGVVYLAHNTLMGRDEVLKVMGRQVIERPGALDRFLREIRAVARLRHPNIVAAYHATRMGESLVFAMEYVEGLDLSRMVKAKGPLPVAHACLFLHQAALGLEHAHEEGLVHRDIKPGNLMLSRKGQKPIVKVLDFGLAKASREAGVDGSLTHEGQALGTPDYIAPEQILDAPSADIRADIYSLGGTFYYLLTGRPPFRANSLYDIYQAHISRDAEPLNLLRSEVPSELAAVVSKMMAKDPARRFQTPAEVAKALMPFFKRADDSARNLRPATSISAPASVAPEAVAPPSTVTSATIADEPMSTEVVSRWESVVDVSSAMSTSDAEAVPTASDAGDRPRWRKPVALGFGGLTLLLGIVVILTRGCGETSVTVIKTPDKAAASTTGLADTIDNTLGMKLKLIPAGEFDMGMSDGQADTLRKVRPLAKKKSYEKLFLKHHVRITKPFYMGVTEVTRAQYRQFVAEQSHVNQSPSNALNQQTREFEVDARYTWLSPGFRQMDNHPVVCIGWSDAVAFCNWLSLKEGVRYRLPTEAEWEYACRAGTTTLYYTGNDPEALTAYENLADATFHDRFPNWLTEHAAPWKRLLDGRDGYVFTAPVGSYKPNPFGLHDMLGNVQEYCSDGYDPDYYQQSPTDDPQGPSQRSTHVVRGSGWFAWASVAASRMQQDIYPKSIYGFRVVREASASARP